ncbi:hypothetical protein ACWCQ1_49765 [Streptomyces sp. NPDC002144]
MFADLSRKGVRLGTVGRIQSAGRATRLLDEGCDFVLIGRAAILERNFPVLVESDASLDFLPRLTSPFRLGLAAGEAETRKCLPDLGR